MFMHYARFLFLCSINIDNTFGEIADGGGLSTNSKADFKRMFSFLTHENVGLSESTATRCTEVLLANFTTTSPVKLAMMLKYQKLDLEHVCMDVVDAMLVSTELKARFPQVFVDLRHDTVYEGMTTSQNAIKQPQLYNNGKKDEENGRFQHHMISLQRPQLQVPRQQDPDIDMTNIVASYFNSPPPSPRFVEANFLTTQEVEDLVTV